MTGPQSLVPTEGLLGNRGPAQRCYTTWLPQYTYD